MIITTRLDRTQIPVSGGTIHLLVQLSAPARESRQRLPLNLAAVVDRSGSMYGPKLDFTKQALLFLVDQVNQADHLAVVAYDDQVQTLVPSQPVVHKDPLKAQLARIACGGSTNLSGGLATGMQQITGQAGTERLSRVLLMTDGLANVGVTDPETLVGWVKSWWQRGLGLSTLGVGDDFNEDLLVAMAEAGGGSFHYIANPDQIPSIFAQELDGLLQVAAQGLQLRAEAEPGVSIDAVLGYPPVGSPHKAVMTLPDLYAGEVKALLLRLQVAAPPASGQLLTLTLDYLPAEKGAVPESITVNVGVATTVDPVEVSRQVKLVEAGIAREEAVALADRGDLHAGAARLAQAVVAMEALALEGDAYAVEQVRALRTEADALERSQYDRATRKQMKAQSFQVRQGRR